uniref:Phosphofructokinase n=1 Tax=Candidatus Kentrum sp. SD TaxID=2126332 RepID=A0A450YYN2_9GAMM|nr:MAG: hexose kinase, 1-phosphofructokinase family [Candidatus Kentron sp. SD]VFK46645.1 MAG: hexose kinase, 1-phosphofructokinase family [Candidatus Kentron sp. SD]VFK80081.1 MAG: hexose kinase, 1-phosphofructokinase family [Candidatus Kentron sp. SD]
MILSVGLSPAWQKILVFDRVRNGQVNRARVAAWRASGKVFNAGIAVHTLGGPGLTMAPVGGVALRPMAEELDTLGMAYRFIRTEAETRVCTTVVEEATGSITELVEEGKPLSADDLERFRRAYGEESKRARVVAVMGSLPQGARVSFYRELLEGTHCPMVLDFRGEGLLSVLDLNPLVVKPNREELERTVGRPLGDEGALREAMRFLNGKGAEWVVVTDGAGPVWVSSAREIYRIQPPRIAAGEIVNPIGSGDAMAGAMAREIGNGMPVVEAVRWGIAAAAQNVRRLFPCRLDPTTLADEIAGITVARLE